MCTHLNVQPRKMVFASSFTIAPDNTGGNPFYYDRGEVEFTVPAGWSFVVTDIIVYASPISGPIPDPNRFVLAVVAFTNGGERHFTASFGQDETRHYSLAGGFTIPAGHTPTFRNTTFSTTYAEANLLGYFVENDALEPGAPAFEPPPGTVTEAAARPLRQEPLSRS